VTAKCKCGREWCPFHVQVNLEQALRERDEARDVACRLVKIFEAYSAKTAAWWFDELQEEISWLKGESE